jgi:nitrile hydratase alpha subunit
MSELGSDPSNRIAQVVARAWLDPVFKNRLIHDPALVLREYGIDVPEGVELRVVEDTDDVIHLHLPFSEG